MLDRSEHFFHHSPRHLKDVPGFECRREGLTLLEDDILDEMVGKLESLPSEESYPLQVAFYEKLLGCDLLLPVPVGTELDMGLPIISLENSKGDKGMPLFSNERGLCLWAEEATDYVALPFATLCGYAMEAKMDYLIINVAGPLGCEIAFHDFSFLADGLIPPPVTEDAKAHADLKPGEVMIARHTPMRLGVSQGLSQELTDRLHHTFLHHRDLIERVYLFDISFNDGPLQPALGIRMPEAVESMWEQALWPNPGGRSARNAGTPLRTERVPPQSGRQPGKAHQGVHAAYL